MAKISVIIPIYNVEQYLSKCLNSILNQTFPDLEIICVNDGSKDSSLQILENFAQKDNRIKIVNKENGGLSSARNAGLEIATSEWISFIDSDDWLDIDTFEKLERMFGQNPDIICFGTHLRGEVPPDIASADSEYYRIKHLGFVDLTDQIRETTDVATWNKLYKKSIIDKYNLRFPVGRHYEDYSFYWEYMFEAKTAFFTDEKFYNYLRRPNSIMANTFNKKSSKIIDHLYASEIIFNYCSKRGILNDHLETFAEIFMNCFWFAYNYSATHKMKKQVLLQATKLLKQCSLDNDFNDKGHNLGLLKAGLYYKINAIDYDKNIWQTIFSIKNRGSKKVIKILGVKFSIKHKNKIEDLKEQVESSIRDKFDSLNKELSSSLYLQFENFIKTQNRRMLDIYLQLNLQRHQTVKIDPFYFCGIGMCASDKWKNLKYIMPRVKLLSYNDESAVNLDYYMLWGSQPFESNVKLAELAYFYNKPLYILEDGFIKSLNTWVGDTTPDCQKQGVSFTIDSKVPYYDARHASSLELMLNDSSLVITGEQKQRAKACIDKIVENHLTKYNHQPIFEPHIGREGVKKVLVVDQSYGDMSIAKGLADNTTFEQMLECAIRENPDSDIIVKTHPDTIAGSRGYYTAIKQHDNIYTQTEPINPISLTKYVDKVYVCTTQLGFEALMCGKEVHVFGMPFYAGWGLTHDRQKCERRTNTRTLEEVFYIAYIMYSYYVNPDKKCRCEIEEAMDYLLKLRDEYFKRKI